MHRLKCRTPRQELREFVRVYAQREIGDTSEDIVEPIPPRLEQCLEFQFGEPFEVRRSAADCLWTPPVALIGAHSMSGTTITLSRGVVTFAIFFQPTGFTRLFGVPMAELTGKAFDARNVLGPPIRVLQSRMADCSTFAARADFVESYLCRRAALLSNTEPIARAALWLFRSNGAVRIAETARQTGLSTRQFERNFARYTGLRPKLYARIARFQTALDTKIASPRLSWLKIAHDLGYHDQMHLIRDFHSLAASAPEQIFPVIGDVRPTSVAPHESSEMSRFY